MQDLECGSAFTHHFQPRLYSLEKEDSSTKLSYLDNASKIFFFALFPAYHSGVQSYIALEWLKKLQAVLSSWLVATWNILPGLTSILQFLESPACPHYRWLPDLFRNSCTYSGRRDFWTYKSCSKRLCPKPQNYMYIVLIQIQKNCQSFPMVLICRNPIVAFWAKALHAAWRGLKSLDKAVHWIRIRLRVANLQSKILFFSSTSNL